MRRVLHVDLDEFVAAVEVLRRPELRGLPVVVGGIGDPTLRGVVSTASYQARAFGVTSGMPLRTAARRCPGAVFLPVDRPAYEAASQQVMAVLRALDTDVGPLPHARVEAVEVLGWDEAFLAVRTDDAHGFARVVQERVRAATALECTVGIGDNPLQAKTATGFGKPRGVFEVTGTTWAALLGDRPPDLLWGIGTRTARRLATEGITTVTALAEADPQRLAARFGPTIGPWLRRVARGEDRSAVRAEPSVPRSRSRETTFQTDLPAGPDGAARIRAEVATLAGQVAADVAADGRPVARVVVKVRHVPFTTSTHGVAIGEPTRDADAIGRAALAALDRFEAGGAARAVRLLGVRAEFPPGDPTPAPGPGPGAG